MINITLMKPVSYNIMHSSLSVSNGRCVLIIYEYAKSNIRIFSSKTNYTKIKN